MQANVETLMYYEQCVGAIELISEMGVCRP